MPDHSQATWSGPMQFDNPQLLAQTADDYGPRLAKMLPTIGPRILLLMQSYGGAFHMRHLKQLMGDNGFAIATDGARQKAAMATIRYVNASDGALYFRRIHRMGTYAWEELRNVDSSTKERLRQADYEHAVRSRNMITRNAPSYSFEQPVINKIYSPPPPQPIPTTAKITAAHIEQMRAGIAQHMQSCGMLLTSIKSPIALMQIYNNACRDGAIDGMEFIDFTPDQLHDALQAVIDIFTDAERGASNTSLANPDGSLDLL